MKLRVLARLLQIQRVLLKHGLDDFVRATHLYRPLRFLFFLSPDTWFERRRRASRGERLRLALEELGPIFVKFGQAVSTRRDRLPPDIVDELAKLFEQVFNRGAGDSGKPNILAGADDEIDKLFQ